MDNSHSTWQRIAAIVLICAAVVAGSALFIHKYFALEYDAAVSSLWPPPTTRQIETRRLRKIAGWFSRDCGHVSYRGDADAAIACASEALKSGQRFYVSFDYIGVDSHGTSGLALDSQRKVYEVVTDELGGGAVGMVGTSGRVLNVSVVACEAAPVERSFYPANRFLTCHPE